MKWDTAPKLPIYPVTILANTQFSPMVMENNGETWWKRRGCTEKLYNMMITLIILVITLQSSTWQWKIHHFYLILIFKWPIFIRCIFHCHVSEGYLSAGKSCSCDNGTWQRCKICFVKQCHKPPMSGKGKHTTYKNGYDWGMVYEIVLPTFIWSYGWFMAV
jgi:hypothetical protein